MKNKKFIGVAIFVLGLLILLYFILWKEEQTKLTEKVVVPADTTEEITEVIDESKQIDEFILSKIPGGDEVFFKREQFTGHSHDVTTEELRKETMQFVYSAFMLQDIDQLTVAFSPDSIRSIKKDTHTIIDLAKVLADFLKLVNREGLLEKLEYQFKLDEYDRESNKGVLTLLYSDGIQILIEIEIQPVGDEDHRAFEVITPLSEIGKLFE